MAARVEDFAGLDVSDGAHGSVDSISDGPISKRSAHHKNEAG
jgi:hypothetical protein